MNNFKRFLQGIQKESNGKKEKVKKKKKAEQAFIWGFPHSSVGKKSACNVGDSGSITPVFLPEESHGQRNLAGYSLWGGKRLDTT